MINVDVERLAWPFFVIVPGILVFGHERHRQKANGRRHHHLLGLGNLL
jgi:hypothetical protein